jgi:integrase/recombinase XerC
MSLHGESRDGDCMDMIDAYIEHLRETSKSRSDETPRSRRIILMRLQRELEFGLDRTDTQELREWLERPNPRTDRLLSISSRATYLECLRSAYAFWANPADPWIDGDPTVGIPLYERPKGRARPGSEDQLTDILARGDEPYALWTAIAAYQGLRAIELSGLDREHVTAARLIVVRGKGGKPRVQDTDALVWDAVRDLPAGPICRLRRDGERASRHYISGMASRYYTSIGYPDLTIHMWRHRLGVQAQRLYRDVRVTQELLGHEALSSTQIYTDASDEQMREARAMLPRPVLGRAGSAGAV